MILLDSALFIARGQADVAQSLVKTRHFGRLSHGSCELDPGRVKLAALDVQPAQAIVQIGRVDQLHLVDRAFQLLLSFVKMALRIGDLGQAQQGQQITRVFGQGGPVVLFGLLPLLAGHGGIAAKRLAIHRQIGRGRPSRGYTTDRRPAS